jgi:hypothetical protein
VVVLTLFCSRPTPSAADISPQPRTQ